METKDRLKLVRKHYKLSAREFGEKIGFSRTGISSVEYGQNPMTDRMARAICNAYNVDYFWLTEGKGEMLIPHSDFVLRDIKEEYDLDNYEMELLKRLLELPKERRKYELTAMKKLSDFNTEIVMDINKKDV